MRVVQETGIPIDLEKVNLADHKTETGQDYLTVNCQKAATQPLVLQGRRTI